MRQLSIDTLAALVEEQCAITRPASIAAVNAVLAGLGAILSAPARGHIARVVAGAEPALRADDRTAPTAPATLAQLVEHVAAATRGSRTTGIEEITVVCAAIAGAWSDEDRRVVTGSFEPSLAELAALFVERPPAAALPHRPARVPEPTDERHTLSTGHPGSKHPLATSAPETVLEEGNAPGVPNPHGAEKLSSGAPALERGQHTLATGRPRR